MKFHVVLRENDETKMAKAKTPLRNKKVKCTPILKAKTASGGKKTPN